MTVAYNSALFTPAETASLVGGVAWSDDATKLYVAGGTYVYQYSVSPAGDLNGTVTYDNKLLSLGTAAGSIRFGNNGSVLLIGRDASNKSKTYPLSVAWDISTAGASEVSISATGSGVAFNNDGTKIFSVVNNTLEQSTLATPWNASTDSGRITVFTFQTGMRGLFFAPDGMAFFTTSADGVIYKYSMNTAWSPGTATLIQRASVASQDSSLYGLAFNAAGSKVYTVGQTNDSIYEHNVTPAWVLADTGSPYLVHAETKWHSADDRIDFSVPPSLVDGDVAFFFGHKDDDIGGNWDVWAVTPGDQGFTHVSTLATAAGNDQSTGLVYKIITDAASEPIAGTLWSPGTTDIDAMEVTMLVVRGADVSDGGVNLFSGIVKHEAVDNTATPGLSVSSLSPADDGCLILFAHGSDDGGSEWTLTTPTATGLTFDIITQNAEPIGIYSGVASAVQGVATAIFPQWNGNDLTAENHVIAWAIKSGGIPVDPTGIASTTAIGVSTLSTGAVAAIPVSIASTSAFGIPSFSTFVSMVVNSIASAALFGVALIEVGDPLLTISSIPSSSQLGAVTVTTEAAQVQAIGLWSTTAISPPTLSTGEIALAPVSLVNTSVFGATSAISVYDVGPTGISSLGAVSSPLVEISAVGIAPASIPSTAGVGTPLMAVNAFAMQPFGIVSSVAFGSADITTIVGVQASGVASIAALGAPVVTVGDSAVQITGIASSEALGALTLTVGPATVSPSGVATTEAFGAATVSTGAVAVQTAGIASAEALGTTMVWTGVYTLYPSPVASLESFGNPTVIRLLSSLETAGVLNTSAFGLPVLSTGSVSVQTSGFASVQAFGLPALSTGPVTVQTSGIASTTTSGTPIIIIGPATVQMDGIASVTALGAPVLGSGAAAMRMDGIASVTAPGAPVVNAGAVDVAPTPSVNTSLFGAPTLVDIPNSNIAVSGIASQTQFGSGFVANDRDIFITPLVNVSAIGVIKVANENQDSIEIDMKLDTSAEIDIMIISQITIDIKVQE